MENVLMNTKFANREQLKPSPEKQKRQGFNPEGGFFDERKTETSEVVLERVGRVLEWFAVRGIRKGEPT
jgi:hypothetical protein